MRRIAPLLPLLAVLAVGPLAGQAAPAASAVPRPAPLPPAPPPPSPLPVLQTGLLVAAGWLAGRLEDPAVVVLHVGREEAGYLAGHLPGARFLPLGAIVVEREGLPNELPDAAALRASFERAGVSDDSHVVLYGELDGLAAARAFFSLEYLGHPRVSLLDGGLAAWRAAGGAVATRPPPPQPGRLTPRAPVDRRVTAAWLRPRLERPDVVLIDARPPAEYAGEQAGGGVERPGHIPGASSLFWRTALVSDDDPRLKDAAALRAMFTAAGARPGRTVVAYCRTGVQASLVYFIARYLGYDARLYDGSFLDWSRRAELPVAR